MPLTAAMGIKIGPVMLGTLIKHYLERGTQTKHSKARDEFLFDEAFTVVKTFLDTATKNTVEELQDFSNTRIPAPPWVYNVRLLVPLSSCDEAARYLIKALGGEEMAKRVAGGIRWWQIRGVMGVDVEWVAVKKDWQTAKKMRKEAEMKRKMGKSNSTVNGESENIRNGSGDSGPRDSEGRPEYDPTEMDPLRCMLYVHGGGYYFGSTDQQRYCIQRYARKMNGRVLSINYRLSPQYPFPCSLHDCLAAYLYLIRPPPNAKHAPVAPSNLILAGDSAGGGTVLALLQIIRDSGLPAPAGAVLISPWVDLAHSFPSVHENMDSDIIPPYGLSLHKPSTLWPPPSPQMTETVRSKLTAKVRSAVERKTVQPSAVEKEEYIDDIGFTANHRKEKAKLVGTPAAAKGYPEDGLTDPAISRTAIPVVLDGKPIVIDSQIQLYCMNHQLTHPLVSPCLGFLGGLPPLLVIASDKEVIRDEIIYIAHKAAHPSLYPCKDETRDIYPAMKGIEERYGATDVHLQVYDETAHVLPMFSFTTPAKFCYRAIATFCKHVAPNTGFNTVPPTPSLSGFPPTPMVAVHLVNSPAEEAPASEKLALPPLPPVPPSMPTSPRNNSFPAKLIRKLSMAKIGSGSSSGRPGSHPPQDHSDDVAGPRFSSTDIAVGDDTAGHPNVYKTTGAGECWIEHMVRERISTSGVIRPLEPPSELAGCNVPLDKICRINEKSAKRYIEGLTAWDKKFGKMAKRIAKERDSNLRLAKQNAPRYIGRLVSTIGRHESRNAKEDGKKPEEEEGESTVLGSPNWSWTWALEGEDPPPSSIVARLDTKEALRLARVADKGFEDTETRMSGNNLWANIMEFLTAGPEHPPQKTPTSSPPRPTKQDIIVTPKPHHSDSSATVVPEGAPQGTAPALGGVLLSSSKLLGGVRRRREEAAKAAGASPSLSTDLETEPV